MPFAEIVFFIVIAVTVIAFKLMSLRTQRLERERFVRRYTFSAEIFDKLRDKYPSLKEKDLYLVARALRQYFLVYLRAGSQTIGMPSKVVDEMWHEFILDTRRYTAFCKKAFGGYFHHIPASKSYKGVAIAHGLKLTWRLACLEENINPKKAVRLPLLFSIDEKLGIPNGNIHKLSNRVELDNAGCGGVACSGSSCSDSSCCGNGGSGGDSGCGGGCGGGD